MKSAEFRYMTFLKQESKIAIESKRLADRLCGKVNLRCPYCTTLTIEKVFFGLFRNVKVKYWFHGKSVQ